jgi:hypothetical protein
MIKNIIIIALVVLLMTKTNVTINEVLEYIQLGLDKAQQLVYNIKSEVK